MMILSWNAVILWSAFRSYFFLEFSKDYFTNCTFFSVFVEYIESINLLFQVLSYILFSSLSADFIGLFRRRDIVCSASRAFSV